MLHVQDMIRHISKSEHQTAISVASHRSPPPPFQSTAYERYIFTALQGLNIPADSLKGDRQGLFFPSGQLPTRLVPPPPPQKGNIWITKISHGETARRNRGLKRRRGEWGLWFTQWLSVPPPRGHGWKLETPSWLSPPLHTHVYCILSAVHKQSTALNFL